MKTNLFTSLLLGLGAAASTGACAATSPAADCAALIDSQAASGPHTLSLPNLEYMGVEHTTDPAHPQLAEMERRWNAFKPTVAYFEGPKRPLPATRDEVVRLTGESGFVRYLAARDNVPVVSLEPSPADELAYVSQRFSAEQVALFYTLREAARLRERQKQSPEQIAAKIDEMLAKIAAMPGFTSPFHASADVAKAYARYWTSPANWWDAPQAWFDPLKPSSATGGIFTNEINAASSHFRNVHMVAKLIAAAKQGKTFAAVGRNHVIAQGAALRCALAN